MRLLVLICMLFALVSCGGEDPAPEVKNEQKVVDEQMKEMQDEQDVEESEDQEQEQNQEEVGMKKGDSSQQEPVEKDDEVPENKQGSPAPENDSGEVKQEVEVQGNAKTEAEVDALVEDLLDEILSGIE